MQQTRLSTYTCVCLCVSTYRSFPTGMLWHKVNFLKIQCFPSPRLVVLRRLNIQSDLLFTHSWKENTYMHIFPRLLILCKMQTALYRIWTRVAMTISYDDNHYTKRPYKEHIIMMQWCYGNQYRRRKDLNSNLLK